MSEADLADAARALADARRSRRQTAAPSWQPTEAQVYRIQDMVAASLSASIAGWKVGARSPGAVPTCAPLLSPIMQSPAKVDAAGMHELGIECEISFQVGRDLPASDQPVAPGDAFAAIASAHPTIEVVDTRVADRTKADPLWLLADNQMNHGLVVGPAWHGWRSHDWARQPVKLTVDSSVLDDKQGGLGSVDPLPVLAWLVDHVVRQRGGLRAGQYITTGSWTGLRYTHRGAAVVASFAGVGDARVTFS